MNVMKPILVTLGILFQTETLNEVVQKEEQTKVYYSHSDSEGHYFTEPLNEKENCTVYVDFGTLEDSEFEKGEVFLATFDDEYAWELLDIEKMEESK